MRFDTTAEDPHVEFECITIEGEVVHRHKLTASELVFRRMVMGMLILMSMGLLANAAINGLGGVA